MRIRIPQSDLDRAMAPAVSQALADVSDRIGAMVVDQVKARFDDSGDEEIRWPALWASDQAKVAAVTGKSQTGNAERDRIAVKARDNNAKCRKRIAADLAAGKITESEARKRRQRSQRRQDEAYRIADAGTSDLYRADGERMRDTGAAQASFLHTVRVDGLKSTIEVGSPLDYVQYHQTGFKTSGPNYIPLTFRAKKGYSPELISGYDYIILQSVTVPPSPMLRFTPLNQQDVINTIAPKRRRR